jgi:gamma-glutamyltranspeptidase
VNPGLAAFLSELDDRGFAEPALADRVERAMDDGGGLVTAADPRATR